MKAEINFTIVYIVGVVIYFIWKNFLRPKKQQETTSEEEPVEDKPIRKSYSEKPFERKIEKASSYEDRHEKDVRVSIAHEFKQRSNYNAISYEIDGIKDKHYDDEMERFEDYDVNEDKFAEEWKWKEKIRTPEGKREAFVMSEIFNKKY